MAAWPICDCCPEGSSPPTPPLLQTPFLSSNAAHNFEIGPDFEWSCIEILPPVGCILAFNSIHLTPFAKNIARGTEDGLIPGAQGLNGKQTNTLIYQVARRRVPWKDDDLWLAANTLWDLDIL